MAKARANGRPPASRAAAHKPGGLGIAAGTSTPNEHEHSSPAKRLGTLGRFPGV